MIQRCILKRVANFTQTGIHLLKGIARLPTREETEQQVRIPLADVRREVPRAFLLLLLTRSLRTKGPGTTRKSHGLVEFSQ